MTTPQHQPVLLEAVLAQLKPQPGQTYFDGTAGYGGHAAAVAQHLGTSGTMILVDRDASAVKALTQRFGEEAQIIQAEYLKALRELQTRDERPDMILLDLGVSSVQIDQASRGFSFRHEAPLDMRMDQTSGSTAADLVNKLPVDDLANLIFEYGEERHSRRVARSIVAARPISTTTELAAAIRRATSGGEIDPATRTFQALRIAVNDELGQLEAALPVALDILKPGGRLAVISFHSLEDRIVKRFFQQEAKDCICPPERPVCTCDHHAQLIIETKRPITASPEETAFNPRARSAKLRVAVKK